MKLRSLCAATAIASLSVLAAMALQANYPMAFEATAQTVEIAAAPTPQAKIDKILAVKGKEGSGDLMRKLYPKSLTPIGIQPGGAGMVVNLYSPKDDTTLSLCTVFDVVVAAKKGKIAKFAPNEVK